MSEKYNGSEIAIIGMGCRFPGAETPDEYWRNLIEGVESLVELEDHELLASGHKREAIEDPAFVRRASVLENIENWDTGFFGYTPLEARVMDPQQRLFMECAWEAFERAGYNPETVGSPVGVFTGAKTNTYLFQLFSNQKVFKTLDRFQIALGNDLASMATRISFKFDLRGPSYAIHTACSTSLVAVHLACQSLLLDECTMALAGGASINVPQRAGYRYQKGGILSPDGSCRTFDADAAGSNFGNGVGSVLLKRLEDAQEDGDTIYAIIRGSATNNDGARKASFTAPGVDGQTAVLLEALAVADVDPETISYIEAHGTATDLGDCIEMLSLTNAFRAGTAKKGFCALGSVKTNLGHLETAAGVAGLIKAALALYHKKLPPSLNFESPNPKIDFDDSPFFVNTELMDWKSEDSTPLRAGVSSFGIGSTNVHVVMEEAPPVVAAKASDQPQLLLLSARSGNALENASQRLGQHLEGAEDLALDTVAHTLQVGRKRFAHRRAIVAGSTADAVTALRDGAPGRVFEHVQEAGAPEATFLFPGLGEHYPGMAKDLYDEDGTFRELLDRCASLAADLGCDFLPALFSKEAQKPGDGEALDFRAMLGRKGEREASPLDATALAQPALFAVEYALAGQWQDWGVEPKSLLGYSLGEYVAATVAGVLTLPDAMKLVVRRAQLIEALPAGAMAAVPVAEKRARELAKTHGVSVSAVMGPELCVFAGKPEGILSLEEELRGEDLAFRRLPTTHAFHSSMMEPIVDDLTELVRGVTLSTPEIPFVSNVTGRWIRDEDATDPSYWARHLCQPVLFGQAAQTLTEGEPRILLEVGPGQGLTSFLKQHPEIEGEKTELCLPTLQNAYGRRSEREILLATAGRLWLAGMELNWPALSIENLEGDRPQRRVPLPTYPFERERHWIEAGDLEAAGDAGQEAPVEASAGHVTLDKEEDLERWFYRPTWKATEAEPSLEPISESARLLVLCHGSTWEEGLVASLRQGLWSEDRVIVVTPGNAFEEVETGYTVRPGEREDYEALFAAMGGTKDLRILHLLATEKAPEKLTAQDRRRIQDHGFFSLLFLAQALARQAGNSPVHLDVVVTDVHRVSGSEPLCPEKAVILGPAKVIPQEFPRITCRVIDLDPQDLVDSSWESTVETLMGEIARTPQEDVVALRAEARLVPHYERAPLPEAPTAPARLRQGGVYLLTGGLGGLGLEVADFLAQTLQAKLILTGRTPLPAWEEWADLLEADSSGEGATDERVLNKIRRIQAMKDAGAEVLAVAVDAADEEAMAALLEEARGCFGDLNGVFHLAGVPGGGLIQLKTRQMAEEILAPKMGGARVLVDLLDQNLSGDGQPGQDALDFFLLFSSVASILGEFGQADYCGANAYLDTLATAREGSDGAPVIAVNWDIWQEVGLAVHTQVPEHLKSWREEMLEKAMRPEEGLEALRRVLEAAPARVVVSAQDLEGRIELGKAFTGERFLEELEKARGGGSPRRGGSFGSTSMAAGVGLERRVAQVWERLLGTESIGVDDNFFDLGGNSLLGLQLVAELGKEVGVEVAPVTLFDAPTVRALTRFLREEMGEAEDGQDVAATAPRGVEAAENLGESSGAIAIVSMAGRFPGASNLDDLWESLRQGSETVTFFTDDELRQAGVSEELLQDPKYVKAASLVEDIDLFDAALFGYSPREAEVMDPQHRLFLEVAWEALERGGYDSTRYDGAIGVFAGSNLSTYLLQMHADPRARQSVNMLQAILGNDKDSLTTSLSYKLNLRGPSIAVQTFCSTSLVAVHMAAQSLRHGECDMALAGGVRLVTPSHRGYLWEDGGIAPPDGHSRSFDAGANGSVLGNGVGIVLLKRLEDAQREGDQILAVIKGSAINNDGSLKAGYTAPSIAGQTEAVTAAYRDAGVDPATVSYVEAHGSATELGDPIEVTALSRAFRRWTPERGYCRIGSVKSNFGHLDRAAGVTGLIKTVLALQKEEIPPTINFQQPNPKIDFAGSPFQVASELAPWKAGETPRRAAVNSLGMGGTNAHVVLEEAPSLKTSGPSRPWQLLPLSAHTETALEGNTDRLARFLEKESDTDLADAAYTLQTGRRTLRNRRFVVAKDGADAIAALVGDDPRRRVAGFCEGSERRVVFLLPGLGGQYPGMARGLYDQEEGFRETVDRCAEILRPLLGEDVREALFPETTDSSEGEGETPSAPVNLRAMLRRGDAGAEADPATERLRQTRISQPALFVIEYALAKLWMDWGIRPSAMVGYSLGEYVAACLAGVLPLKDALKLVVERARLIDASPGGAMIAVAASASAMEPLLGEDLSIAGINGPEQTVVAGPEEAIAVLEAELEKGEVTSRRLQTSHAFHSSMMEPLRGDMEALGARLDLQPPQLPYFSNVTGTWLSPEEATDPTYWGRHLCQPVRFAEAAEELLKEPGTIFLEVGPGQTLSSLLLQHPTAEKESVQAVGSLRHAYEVEDDLAVALSTLGKLWVLGVEPDWNSFWQGESRRRIALPTYAFDRKRYWIDTVEPIIGAPGAGQGASEGATLTEVTGLQALSWSALPAPRELPESFPASLGRWWLLTEDGALDDALREELRERGAEPLSLLPGKEFRSLGDERFEVRPGVAGDLLSVLESAGKPPQTVIVAWGRDREGDAHEESYEKSSRKSLAGQALDALAEAFGAMPGTRLVLLSREMFQVSGDDVVALDRARDQAAMKSFAARCPDLICRIVDSSSQRPRQVARAAVHEAFVGGADGVVACRGARRWQPALQPAGEVGENVQLSGGILLFDGLGERCFPLTEGLASQDGVRLLTLEPTGFPPEEEWSDWLAADEPQGLLSQRILRARDLRQQGANLTILATDRTDKDSLSGALVQAKDALGSLDGLVYASEPPGSAEGPEAPGVSPDGPSAHRLSAFDRSLRGLLHLEELLEDKALGGNKLGENLRWALLLASPQSTSGSALEQSAADLALASFAEARQGATEVPWHCLWWARGGTPEERAETLNHIFAAPWAQLLATDAPAPIHWSPALSFLQEAEGTAAPEEAPSAVGLYDRPELRVEFVAPRNELETTIAGAWKELLGVEKVGVHDSFLELGGDSLLASRLVTRLRQIFDLDLPIRLLFEASTVGELAKHISELQSSEQDRELESLMAEISSLSGDDLEQEILRREAALKEED